MKRYLVYFFGTDYERVKIGSTMGNIYQRKNQIQTGCPEPIKLLGIIQCIDEGEMKRREIEIHRQFKEFQTSGEWFRLVPEISAYIEDFTESGEDILDEACHFRREYHRDYNRKYARERYQNNPEVRERQRENGLKWRENNREYNRERKREWYINNKERADERRCEYRQLPEVKERERKYARERYQNNPEVRECQRKYRQRPEVKERRREQAKQRKSRKGTC